LYLLIIRLTLLCLCLFWTTFSFGQHRGRVVTDSIMALFPEAENDTRRVDLYNQLGREFRDRGLRDSSLIFAKKALVLSEKNRYKKGQIDAHLNLGNTYREQKQLTKAIDHIRLLIELAEKENNQIRQGDAHDNLGHIYYELGDTAAALRHHLLSLKIRKQVKDEYGIGNSCDNIGHIYAAKSQFSDAVIYFDQSLDLFTKIGDTSRITLSMANSGYQYYYMGNAYQALERFTKSLELYKKLKNNEGIEWMANLIAYVYSDIGYYDKALKHYFEQLKQHQEEKDDARIVERYALIGRAYLQMGNYQEAMKYEKKALDLGKKINSLWVRYIYHYIGTIKESEGNPSEALTYYIKSYELAVKENDVYWQAATKNSIGSSYFKLKNISEAKKWLTEGLALSLKVSYIKDIANSYLYLSKIDSLSGNYQSAYENYQQHIRYKKSLQEDEAKKLAMKLDFKEKEMHSLRERRQAEKIANQELQNRNQQRNMAIGGFVLMLLLVLTILYLFRLRNKKIRIEQQNIELKQRELETVKETEQFKSRFLANISHEFRTPLTLINGNIELLKSSLEPGDLKKLEEMNQNGDRLLQLVNQLLDLSKMESGQYALKYGKGNLLNETQAFIMAFDSYAVKEKIEFTMHLNTGVRENSAGYQFYYSAEALQTIINNLLSNAIKFTPSNGKIQTTIDFQDDLLMLTVSDSGPGIPEEYISKIFERFYQVDEMYTATQKGSGIGLALVKELAMLHGGDVSVENKPEGGSCFKVWLHCEKAEEQVAEAFTEDELLISTEPVITERTEKVHQTEEKPLILVVEDQPELRTFITANIGADFQYIEAENGEIGLELANAHLPDLIISDVMMPVLNGLELCRAIKGNHLTSHIPFILLTAKADQDDKISGLQVGADDYVVKPFSIEELRLRIRNAIRLQESIRNQFQNGQVPVVENVKELSARDREFLRKLTDYIEENISNTQLGVNDLTGIIHLSLSQLTRKLKTITGHTPSDLIKNIRLQKALELLKSDMNVSEVSWAVGFDNPAYFGKVFKKHFGVAPSEI
jgi:signal transduction histidine kinase/DNA-binding response OmpR family regulator